MMMKNVEMRKNAKNKIKPWLKRPKAVPKNEIWTKI